jgi:predicted ArsR family transcriptional regulator
MFSQALRDIARRSYTEILEALKRSDGMAVSELAKELKMSYMGVKQHCVNLEKKGYLETWRVPRSQVGRPEKLYRLTKQCDELFPEAGTGLTLNFMRGVQQMYGDSAPEKLLMHHFEDLRSRWAPKITGAQALVERVTRLAELRDATGAFSRCRYDAQDGLRIEEYHNPLAPIFKEYPNALRMETQMMERLLGTKVDRRLVSVGKGRQRIVYEVASLGTVGARHVGNATADRSSAITNPLNKTVLEG